MHLKQVTGMLTILKTQEKNIAIKINYSVIKRHPGIRTHFISSAEWNFAAYHNLNSRKVFINSTLTFKLWAVKISSLQKLLCCNCSNEKSTEAISKFYHFNKLLRSIFKQKLDQKAIHWQLYGKLQISYHQRYLPSIEKLVERIIY